MIVPALLRLLSHVNYLSDRNSLTALHVYSITWRNRLLPIIPLLSKQSGWLQLLSFSPATSLIYMSSLTSGHQVVCVISKIPLKIALFLKCVAPLPSFTFGLYQTPWSNGGSKMLVIILMYSLLQNCEGTNYPNLLINISVGECTFDVPYFMCFCIPLPFPYICPISVT